MTWEFIIEQVLANGLWAALFIGLMIYILKDANIREQKYQKVISDLTNNIKLINEIKIDIKEIKEKLNDKKNKKVHCGTCDENKKSV